MRTSTPAKLASLGCSSILIRIAVLLAVSSTAACAGSATPETPTETPAAGDAAEGADDTSTPTTPSGTPESDGEPQTTSPSSSPSGCAAGVTVLKLGQKVTFSATPGGNGNQQRDYCFELSASATITLKMTDGSCSGSCVGDDVELYLKFGDAPDPFSPDKSTTSWTYTPAQGGFHDYVKAGKPGAWYLSIIDSANTLGYKNVNLTVTAK